MWYLAVMRSVLSRKLWTVIIDIDDEMLMMNNSQESQTADDIVGFVLR